MKNYRKYLISFAMAALTVTAASGTAFAGQWKQGENENQEKWWYDNLDGTYPTNEWVWIDGNSDGIAERYYFDQDGWMLNSTSIDGEKVDSTGAWIDGSGAVQVKKVSDGGVETNGVNEISTGTIDLGSDLDLGTEWEAEDPPTGETSASESSSKKTGDVVEIGTDLSSLKDFRENSSSDEEDNSSYAGPGIGGVNVFTVSAGPNAAGNSTDSAPESSASSVKKEASNFSGTVGSSSDAMPRAAATELVNYARSFIGSLRYVTAGSSLETGADCSGFTQQIFKHFGITIPRDSRSQYAAAEKISVEELKPGDLIFYGSSPSTIYHVGIYSGNGTIVHSTHSGDYVREHDAFYAKPYGYGRYTK